MSKRNGKIDFLRFIFALFIMFLHFGYRPEITIGRMTLILGNQGSFGVNFFFAVSGFLLSKTVEKMSNVGADDISGQYTLFIKKKYLYYMTWYLPAFLSTFLLDVVYKEDLYRGLNTVISSIPNLILLGSLGFSEDSHAIGYYVGASWFVSALFCVQVIFFPLMRHNYRLWSRVLQPILFLITISLQVNGHSDRILRALTPMLLGGIGYEIAKYLSECNLSLFKIILMRILEFLIYMECFIYMCTDSDSEMSYGMTILISIGVMLSFCPQTKNDFFEHTIFTYLGKISFPLYLLHIQVLHWGEYIIERNNIEISENIYYPIMYIIALLVAILAYQLSNMLKQRHRS